MRILGFYHICLMNHWQEIVQEQIDLIVKTKLYAKTDKIFVACLGSRKDGTTLFKILPEKFTIVFHNEDIKLCEIPILEYLQNLSKQIDFKAWYIHTKGVFSEKKNKNVKKWRKIMEYFIIENHEVCIELLSYYDACGIDLRYLQKKYPEYSEGQFWCFVGNFWWSKSEHIKKLPNINALWLANNKSRYTAEVFIGLNSSKLCTLFNREIDHPQHPIAEHVYKNKNIIAKKQESSLAIDKIKFL